MAASSHSLLRAAAWLGRRTGEPSAGDLDRVLISIEGTRSYGAQIAALLAQAGYRVIDAPSPKRERGIGKNDHIDAVVVARGSLHKRLDQLADARAGDTSTRPPPAPKRSGSRPGPDPRHRGRR